MGVLDEPQPVNTPLSDALSDGLDDIRYSQTITFVPYVRMELPLDKFIFWVKYDQVGKDALASLGLSADGLAPVTVKCAIHSATSTEQGEEDNMDYSKVVVTCTHEIRPFHEDITTVMWVADLDGIRFAIDSRAEFFKQANLYHYHGGSIYPTMLTQMIDDASEFDVNAQILSDSTPLWMAMAKSIKNAVWLPGFDFPLYPRFLVPDNEVPPYGVIIPDGGSVEAQSLGPAYAGNSSRSMYVTELVSVVLYGCQNSQAMDFLDSVLGYAATGLIFGVNNSPVVEDVPREQSELSVLAQKKRIVFKINYYQSAARNMAIRYIKSCIPNITVEF